MKKFENFCRALKNLQVIETYEEPYDLVTEVGLVGLFEICFEQSWKCMKETLLFHGYDESQTGLPRMILKLAFQAGMINDETGWLKALNARNEVPHTYNEEIALAILRQTKEEFLGLFQDLKAEIEKNWN